MRYTVTLGELNQMIIWKAQDHLPTQIGQMWFWENDTQIPLHDQALAPFNATISFQDDPSVSQ